MFYTFSIKSADLWKEIYIIRRKYIELALNVHMNSRLPFLTIYDWNTNVYWVISRMGTFFFGSVYHFEVVCGWEQ